MTEYIGKQKILNRKIEKSMKSIWALCVLTAPDGEFTQEQIDQANQIKTNMLLEYEEYLNPTIEEN